MARAGGEDNVVGCGAEKRTLTSLPSFLCLSQESSAPKSLGAEDIFTVAKSYSPRRRVVAGFL